MIKINIDGKTEKDMLNSFVSSSGHRYASSKTYEAQLSGLYYRIKKSTDIDSLYKDYKKYKVLCGK